MTKETETTQIESYSILLVMLSAIAGWAITFCVINSSIIKETHPPDEIRIIDGNTQYNLKVTNLDSLKFHSTGSGLTIKDSIDKSEIMFHQNPAFLVWIMLALLMMTTASGGFPLFVSQNILLKKRFELSRKQMIHSFLLSVAIIALLVLFLAMRKGLLSLPVLINHFSILLENGNLIQWLVIAIFLLLIPALMLMFLIGPCSISIFSKTATRSEIEKAAQELNFLNKILLTSLQYLAVIVVLAVLTTSSLGAAVKAAVKVDGLDLFPPTFSYTYGLYFTFFLGIMYIPVYIFLKVQSNRLEDVLYRFLHGEAVVDEKWVNKVSDSISMKNTALDNIKMAFTVLSPLITSFLPEQLHFFT